MREREREKKQHEKLIGIEKSHVYSLRWIGAAGANLGHSLAAATVAVAIAAKYSRFSQS